MDGKPPLHRAVTRQPGWRRPYSRGGIRNEPAKKRDLSGSVGAMAVMAAGPGKLKNHYAPCFFRSRIQVAKRLAKIVFLSSLFSFSVHLISRSKTLILN
jgi:hypothetical protein